MSVDLLTFSESVRQRFRSPTIETVFARLTSADPIAISRVIAAPTWTERVPPEDAFTIHIQVSSSAKAELYVDGRPRRLPIQGPCSIRILDMSTSPYAHIESDIEFIRLNFSQRTLDELSYDHGQRRIPRFQQVLDGEDQVLYGLGCALIARFNTYGPDDQLFLDYLALAMHAHLIKTYADIRGEASWRGGLAPWQFRRACEMMAANLGGDMGIADLAMACELSASHFAAAFRRTAGMPPHRWLMNERVNQAKRLLRSGRLRLADIALACGFSDQSHLTRVFLRIEGQPPSRWRRLCRS
ncbi:AraC family transcriptional regulator [Dyella choica]|uniref:AraC family transcriptional regulator n=1 Tax=Dyella choica TaxID=1927959 RepID=A0A3S0PJM6_9GAMM|nr:AraC family transcriptional regulator [Dyella choica]RUL77539.1 AraC family transcriptional regulator [Dyella choica]